MCDCIKTLDADIAKHNAAIETNIFGTPMALICLYKKDEKKRGRLPRLQATFCPFCGEKYKRTARDPAGDVLPPRIGACGND